jgi:hypothetical protein
MPNCLLNTVCVRKDWKKNSKDDHQFFVVGNGMFRSPYPFWQLTNLLFSVSISSLYVAGETLLAKWGWEGGRIDFNDSQKVWSSLIYFTFVFMV